MNNETAGLKRSLSLPLLTLYGLGNILGAGIYVLIGKVVATAGLFTPWSFLIASIIAGLTAFSYAELSSRYPLSAGEAVYLQAGFRLKYLSAGVGILIILAGIVSAAAISRGFVGYFQQFWSLPTPLVIILLVGALGGLAIWGIVNHFVFYRVPRAVLRVLPTRRMLAPTVKLLSGVLALFALYGAQTLGVYALAAGPLAMESAWVAAALYLASLPPSGVAALVWLEATASRRRSARTRKKREKLAPDAVERLRDQRAELMAMLTRAQADWLARQPVSTS